MVTWLCYSGLDNAAGNEVLSPKIVENELAVPAQRACNPFHRLDTRPNSLAPPNYSRSMGEEKRVPILRPRGGANCKNYST